MQSIGKSANITILGCGASAGVPLIGNYWGACDPNNEKNKRQRSAIHLDVAGKSLLIDAGPDIKNQLITSDIQTLDAVLFTHIHADHTHGIDDLRPFNWINKKDTPLWSDVETMQELKDRFAYCFPENGDRPTPTPRFEPHSFIRNEIIQVEGMDIQTIDQDHGFCHSIGYRFGNFCYSIDVWNLEEESLERMKGIKYWIVGCNRYEEHPAHAHLDKVLKWVDYLKPERTILSNMSQEFDYETLLKQLPRGVEPGFDGLKLEITL